MLNQLTTDLEAAGKALYDFTVYLNSPQFYELSLRVGVHACAVIFTAFAFIMIGLLIIHESPRPKTHFLWTWIVVSLAFFLIRAVAIVHYGDDGRIFIFAMAWWNLAISGTAALLTYSAQALAALGGKAFSND